MTTTKEKYDTLEFDSLTEKLVSDVLRKCQEELESDPDTLIGIMSSNMLCEIMKKSSSLTSIIVQNFILNFCIETINLTQLRNE